MAETYTYEQARQWAHTGMLAAFALLLAYAETFLPLPIPVPGAKLGLANVAILMALESVGWRNAFAVALIKTLVTGFLFGSPIMLPYSAAGTLLAFVTMAVLVKVPGLSVVIVSMFGGALHIAGQLAVATVMLGTTLVWFSFPVLLVIALVTGALTGLVARYLIDTRNLVPTVKQELSPLPQTSERSLLGARPVGQSRLSFIGPGSLLLFLLIYTIGIFLTQTPLDLVLYTLVALGAVWAARLQPKTLAKALVPLASILIITAVAQFLYLQQGQIVAHLGPLAITREALEATVVLFVRLLCLMSVSTALMVSIDGRQLLQGFERTLERLPRQGSWAQALTVALDLALDFVPILMDAFENLRNERKEADAAFATGSPIKRLKDYASLLAPLAAMAYARADAVAFDLLKASD